MIGFFKFFIGLLLIAIAAFVIIATEQGFECPLPHGGYFRVHWNPEKKKIDLFYWQPKKNAKPLPKNVIRLEGENKKPEVKPAPF